MFHVTLIDEVTGQVAHTKRLAGPAQANAFAERESEGGCVAVVSYSSHGSIELTVARVYVKGVGTWKSDIAASIADAA